MWKKAVPVIALSSVLLVGCNMDKTVPSTNETPMQDIKDDTRRLAPDVNTPSPNTQVDETIVNPNGTTNQETITEPNVTNPNGTITNDGTVNEPNVKTGNEEIIQEDVKVNNK